MRYLSGTQIARLMRFSVLEPVVCHPLGSNNNKVVGNSDGSSKFISGLSITWDDPGFFDEYTSSNEYL
jgi:hypothetical protein